MNRNSPLILMGLVVAAQVSACAAQNKTSKNSAAAPAATPPAAPATKAVPPVTGPVTTPQNNTAGPMPTPAGTPSPAPVSAPTPAAIAPLTAEQLAGSWLQTSCAAGLSKSSSKDTVQFTGQNYADTRQYYSDPGCTISVAKSAGGVLSLTGTFNVVGANSLPAADNPQNAPAGLNVLALNITTVATDYGAGSTAAAAAAAYQKQGCAGASVSGTVVNLTSCFGAAAGPGAVTYQFVLANASGSALSIGDFGTITGGCSSAAGAPKGACTVDQLAAQAATFQKQ